MNHMAYITGVPVIYPESIRISGMKYNETIKAVFKYIFQFPNLEILFSLK
jgi:hypothetical protein